MFLRFDTPVRDACSRVGTGIFQPALACWYETPAKHRLWQHYELRRELDWFNDRLEAPARMYYRPGRRGGRSGVCWFRNHACEHIRRARYMAWILHDLGIHTRALRSTDPGAILWQDDHQVVALPAHDMDTRRYFH